MTEPAQVHTVTQLTRRIRMMLEIQVGQVWVDGEISNYRPNKSGHVYFTLKDENAQLSAVMFRSQAARLRFPPRDGMQARAFGEISVYEAQGKYQLVVSKLEEKGVGSLQARFEELKRKLEAEGLFDPARKRPLPRFPRVVALVTSPTGAAVRDLLDVLGRRAPWVRVLVAPVRVQGRGAEDEIAAALELLGRESGRSLPAIDTVIVGRGGGSIEDLWCFNEEVVARAIAACRLPVISAVGHEIDFTIADFAADLRAPTPSAAAELAVPDGVELRRRLAGHAGRLASLASGRLDNLGRLLAARSRDSLVRSPGFRLREAGQHLDARAARLDQARNQRLELLERTLRHARGVLAAARPDLVVGHAARRLQSARERLAAAAGHRLARRDDRCRALGGLLASLGPQAVLDRGFSYTLGPDGRPLRDPSGLRAGDRLVTRLAAGEVASSVLGPHDPPRA
jgi:exodeoxyribonuclease VII large subunit